MRRRASAGGRSYPVGAVRLTEAYLASDPPRRAEIEALEENLAAHLGEVAAALRQDPAPLVAMGGTVRNLARAVQKQTGYPLGRQHGYFLERRALEKMTSKLLALPVGRRRRIGGIHPDRADVILAGALVYCWLLRHGERDGVWISGYGVREGALFEHFLPPPHRIRDLRSFSLHNFYQCYRQPQHHIATVRRLARRLFDGLAPLHGLGPPAAELLDAAALLHDIGMAVGYHYHHKHGAYLIATTHLLNGFTHREQVLLMLLVRYHRKGAPSWGMWRDLAQPGDKKLLLHLAACLRLAEYLERSQAGRVEDVRIRITATTVTLELVAPQEPSVEIWEARKHAPLFVQAFERELVLTHHSKSPTR